MVINVPKKNNLHKYFMVNRAEKYDIYPNEIFVQNYLLEYLFTRCHSYSLLAL